MSKVGTYFPQISVAVAQNLVLRKEFSSRVFCAICIRPVPLEACKVDEAGSAVHEHCYFTKVSRPFGD